MLASIQSKTDFLAPSSSSSTRSFSTSMARSSRELIPRAMEKLVERRRRSSRTRCFRGRKKKFRPRRIREPLFFSTSIEKRSFALFSSSGSAPARSQYRPARSCPFKASEPRRLRTVANLRRELLGWCKKVETFERERGREEGAAS